MAQEPSGAPETASGPAGADVSPSASADSHPTVRTPVTAGGLRIGRAPDNDRVISDLSVSRNHAVLRQSDSGRYEILDLDSYNGTYVNGARVRQADVGERDIISIGHATFWLDDGALVEYIDTGDVSLEARGLTVLGKGDKILVDHVSFPVGGRCLVAVIGTSGAGKSTLLNALSGMRPADTGSVLYGDRDLYSEFDELRHRIGFVPQEDIVHPRLSPRTALGFTAELRFPGDASAGERARRVEEVLAQLSLIGRADAPAQELSGGQRKRLNVAPELLTKPSLLFLDEPTSGLDPGLDAQFMEQMRDLAHGEDGRTIILVTHSMENLHVCDWVLVLLTGAKVAYYGPPDDALAYFGQRKSWADVFRAFSEQPDRDWAEEFRQSGEYARYVVGPMVARPRPPRPLPPGQEQKSGRQALPLRPSRGWVRQLRTLTWRYLRLIWAEYSLLIGILLVPFGLGGLALLVSLGNNMTAAGNMLNAGAQPSLLVLIIMVCLTGVVFSIREVVKERPIYIRERAAGLSAFAYLGSKAIVLCVIAAYQAAVMTAIGFPANMLPRTGSLLGNPRAELILATALLDISLTCLGLLLSTLLPSTDLAMQAIVAVTMIQFVLSGSVISPAGIPGLAQVTWLAPARWGTAAIFSTLDMNKGITKGADPLWANTPGQWLFDMGMMVVWSLIYLGLAWWRLTSLTPGRRKTDWRQFAHRVSRSVLGR